MHACIPVEKKKERKTRCTVEWWRSCRVVLCVIHLVLTPVVNTMCELRYGDL